MGGEMGGECDFGVREVSFGVDCGGREVRNDIRKVGPGSGGSVKEIRIGLLDGA